MGAPCSRRVRIRAKKIDRDCHSLPFREFRDGWTPAPWNPALFPVLHNPVIRDAELRRHRRVTTKGIDEAFRHGHLYVTWRDALSSPLFLTPLRAVPMITMAMPRISRDDKEMVEVGQRLADTREALDLTQQELAELFHISRTAIANWEGGRGLPDPSRMITFRATYSVPTDWIYAGVMAGLPNDLLAKILAIRAKRVA